MTTTVRTCEWTEQERNTVRALLRQENIDIQTLDGGRAWGLSREGAAPAALEAAARAARACARAWTVVLPRLPETNDRDLEGGATTAALG